MRPKSVVTSASEMPPASGFGSPDPKTVMRLKVAIMPETVPSRPRRGDVAAVTAMTGRSAPALD